QAEVGRLIRLTKTHDVAAGDPLGAIMISIDLSILGADVATYDAYAAAIRQEYAHVPDAAYRSGRAAGLHRLSAPARDLSGRRFCGPAGTSCTREHRPRAEIAAGGIDAKVAGKAYSAVVVVSLRMKS